MVDPLNFALANLRIVDQFKKLAKDSKASEDSDPGRAYNRITEWKEKRTHLISGGAYKQDKQEDSQRALPCESPAVMAFRNLFSPPCRPGVVNVLYDQSGTGKSMAGVSVLEYYYLINKGKDSLKGIMVSTEMENPEVPYVELLGNTLQTSSVQGWLHLLLLVLGEPVGEFPSLLILDDFYQGKKGENLSFISNLYKALNRPNSPVINVIVVVLTQDLDTSNKLCAMNGGQRIQPMRGFYEEEGGLMRKMNVFVDANDRKRHARTHPVWIKAKWTRELFIQVIEYHFTAAQNKLMGDYDFVKEGMTPYEARAAAESFLLDSRAGIAMSPKGDATAGTVFFPDDRV